MKTRPDHEIKIRLDGDLKQAFKRACSTRDMSLSQVLRQFMRAYVSDCSEATQRGLFENTPVSTSLPSDTP